MKVICKTNHLGGFSDENILNRLRRYISDPEGETELQIGKEYTVYGIVFWDNSPWYYLCTDEPDVYEESSLYPKPFAAEFFNIADGRLSSYWTLSTEEQENGKIQSSLVFSEWTKDPMFYENLLNEVPYAIELFKKYHRLMNQE